MGIFSKHFQQATDYIDPAGAFIGRTDPIAKAGLGALLKKEGPPGPPGPPNPNDAANAAQAQTDQMRMRRGMLANIYAGSSNTAPVVGGKTQLG